MKTSSIIEGLTILSRYYDKPDGYNVAAEHDVLYAYATNRALSNVDLARMIELGWFQEHSEYDGNADFALKDYRPEESWQAFT